MAHEGNITIALDITIDEDLIDEGVSRELISRIQNIRKASGFEVTDRIKIVMLHNDRIARAVDKNIDYMKSETLANSIELKKDLDNGTEVNFDKIKIKIFITKE